MTPLTLAVIFGSIAFALLVVAVCVLIYHIRELNKRFRTIYTEYWTLSDQIKSIDTKYKWKINELENDEKDMWEVK